MKRFWLYLLLSVWTHQVAFAQSDSEEASKQPVNWGVSLRTTYAFTGFQNALTARASFGKWEANIGLQYPLLGKALPDPVALGYAIGARRTMLATDNKRWSGYLEAQWQSTMFEVENCEGCNEDAIRTGEFLILYGFAWQATERWQLYQSIGTGFFIEEFEDDFLDEESVFTGLNAGIQIGVTYAITKR